MINYLFMLCMILPAQDLDSIRRRLDSMEKSASRLLRDIDRIRRDLRGLEADQGQGEQREDEEEDDETGLDLPDEPLPPEPVDIPRPTVPSMPLEYDLFIDENGVKDASGNNLYSGNKPLNWAFDNGVVEGSRIQLRGSHPSLSINGSASGRLRNAWIVGYGGASVDGVKISESKGGVEELRFWRTEFRNPKNSKAAFRTVDAKGNVKAHGIIGLHGCFWKGADGAYVWAAEYVDSPGVVGDRVATKWWIEGKTAAQWQLTDMVFPAAQEHCAYLHYAQSFYASGIVMHASGGTMFQFANRAGRVEPGKDPYYYGNPDQPPAGLVGPLIVENCEHFDADLTFRDSSSVSIYGYLNDVYVSNLKVHNAPGAFVHVADSFKGAYLVGGGVYNSGGPEFPAGRFVTPRLYLNNVTVDGVGHNREQIMISGVENVQIGSFNVVSNKPQIVFDTQGSGGFYNGTVGFYDKQSALQASRIGRYDVSQGKNVFYTEEEILELVVE